MNRTIYMTWKTLDLSHEERSRINSWEINNPGYKIVLLDDNMLENLIKSNPSLHKIFKRIKCGAAKADLFRYFILYQNGGVYVDVDCRCSSKHFLKQLEEFELVTCIDVHPSLIFQGFLFSNKPQHPFFKKCLENIVYNYNNNLYKNDVFSFSGPILAARCILPYVKHADYIFKEGKNGTFLLNHFREEKHDWIEFRGNKVINCQEDVEGKRNMVDYGIIWQ